MNRAILITGCSSGIGHCTAKGLQARGYQVLATARQQEDVEKLRNEGLNCHQLDLQSSDSIHTAFEWAMEQSDNRLFALFNNGAYGQPGAVEDLSRGVLREQFETNLFGTHELTCLALKNMRKYNEGRIIQNSSLLGYVSLRFRGAYNASKYALEGLSDTLRLELMETDIHVSLIEPGPIMTKFRQNAFAMYQKNIHKAGSPFEAEYNATEKRLQKKGAAAPFTLPPEAVLKKVLHALESKNPKARYPVTFPAYLFHVMKRILSTKQSDYFLRKVE